MGGGEAEGDGLVSSEALSAHVGGGMQLTPRILNLFALMLPFVSSVDVLGSSRTATPPRECWEERQPWYGRILARISASSGGCGRGDEQP